MAEKHGIEVCEAQLLKWEGIPQVTLLFIYFYLVYFSWTPWHCKLVPCSFRIDLVSFFSDSDYSRLALSKWNQIKYVCLTVECWVHNWKYSHGLALFPYGLCSICQICSTQWHTKPYHVWTISYANAPQIVEHFIHSHLWQLNSTNT